MAKRNKNSKESKVGLDLHPETHNSIVGILLFAVFLISVLSYFGRAGRMGGYFFKIMGALLGGGYFLIPLALLFAAIVFLTSRRRNLYLSTIIGSSLFVLSFLALMEIVAGGAEKGIHKGGYLGFIFSYPFSYLFGFWASLIFLTALALASLVIIFNYPLKNLKFWGKKQPKESPELVINSPQFGTHDKSRQVKDTKVSAKDASADSVLIKDNRTAEAKKEKGEENGELKANKQMVGSEYKLPPFDLLSEEKGAPLAGDVKAYSTIIKKTLENFGIPVEIGEINVGPTVTQYTLKPAQGVKLSRIIALQNDLSLALAAHPIRIEAPIPGRSLVGIEIPNKNVAVVRLRNLIENSQFWDSSSFLTFVLGRDVAGNPNYADLARMPHILVAGSTGSGKSVAIHSILISLLYRNSPESMRLLLIDPKRVELNLYNGIPHLLSPVITEGSKAVNALRWAIKEMEQRYRILAEWGARDIGSYNNGVLKKGKSKETEEMMPYIVIVIDELADLMAAFSREMEGGIVRLAQMARAVGIHLIISTQRPSVEVLTGLIKANITSRIALQTATQIDSRTILDASGAEKLLGRGDMLFVSSDTSKPKRIQGCFISDKEAKKVVDFIKSETKKNTASDNELKSDLESEITVKKSENVIDLDATENDTEDDLFEDARELVIEAGKASASLLQRRLRIGYARAARILDIMEDKGIVGPADGAKPREVYVGKEEELYS